MPQAKLILTGIIAVLTMSAVPVLVKSTEANEYAVGLARLGIAVLAFTPLILFRGHLLRLSARQWLQLVIIGCVFGLHWLTYFMSIKLATAAIAALTIITYSGQYLVLAYIFNGERVTAPEWLAILICFVGCVIVSPEFSLGNSTSAGIAVGLFSALLYAAMPLLHQRARAIGTLERTWGQFFFALLVFLPFWGKANWNLSTTDIYQLVVLGLLCTVVSHGLWVKASTELPAIYSSMIYYLYLPGALVGSVVFLGEEITAEKLLGCALVLAASTALSIYRYRRSRGAV
ncbi:DMT family transporter [Pseudohalioglobus lutimaris]|uniref:EamA/RhaT family transporter n=1 Tax=Pseudohalioglobus lutimaris TaxID=1737061 RepID=A0A2N5X8D7_9GAMM|nr:DMT family transporter [Pseudohalioglobus lutimaris]PLW70757.1 EamA/RhaT family transporter [Pseudohalioglobus lutimaris]